MTTNKGLMGKRIPTVFAIILLLVGLGAGVYLVSQQQNLTTKAGPTDIPRNVKITNKGSSSLSISWTTDTPVTGYVKYSEDPTKITQPAGDLRDQATGTSNSYTNHYVNITNLSPQKTYYFLIGSGPQTYDENGKPYQIQTLSSVAAPPEDVISGKVVGSSSEAINGAIVYVEIQGGDPLSAITKTDGSWRINLATARDPSGAVLNYDKQAVSLSIFVQAGSAGSANAVATAAKARPLPDIVLNKNQAFTDGGATIIEPGGESIGGAFPASETGEEEVDGVSITYPKKGESVPVGIPEFFGKAKVGDVLTISLKNPAEVTQTVEAREDATWRWSPPAALTEGENEITLSWTDGTGVDQALTSNFLVVASSIPGFSATPSSEVAGEIIPDGQTMPATESSELTGSGSDMAMMTVIVGVLMVVASMYAKKKLVLRNSEK